MVIPNELRKTTINALLKKLIVIDKVALEEGVDVSYLIDDFWKYLNVDYAVAGERIKITENRESLGSLVVETTSPSVEKYKSMFISAVDEVFSEFIKPKLTTVDETLRVLYNISGTHVVYTSKGLHTLFVEVGQQKVDETVLKLAFIYNEDIRALQNETVPRKASTRNNHENAILDNEDRIVASLSDLGLSTRGGYLNSKFGRMIVTNKDTGLQLGNNLVDDEEVINTYEAKNSIETVCPASGHKIVVCTIFPLPRDIIESDGQYFYKEAYKLWAMSKKYNCTIEKYRNPDYGFNMEIFKFNDKSVENIEKALKHDEQHLELYTRINNYSARPRRFLYVNSDGSTNYYRDKLYMGVEMEFDEGGTDNENNHLFVSATTNYKPFLYSTTDSSVSGGFESKTYPTELGALMDKNLFNFELGFKTLKDRGYVAGRSNTCGLHIHLSKKFFTTPLDKFAFNDDDLDKLGLTLLSMVIENNWKDIVPFTRRTRDRLDNWARNNKKLTSSRIKELQESVNHKSLHHILEDVYRSYKDHSNAVNNNKRETFELRIFKGTLDKTALLASAQFSSNLSYIVRDAMKKVVVSASSYDDTALREAFKELLEVSFNDIVNYNSYEELNSYVSNYENYLD